MFVCTGFDVFFVGERRAWEIIEEVGYVGYDALLPFRTAVKNAYFPYTPYWQGTAQLNKACELILEEGLGKVIARHQKVAGYCRERIVKMGLKLYPAMEAVPSPTVTAVYVPQKISWKNLDTRLAAEAWWSAETTDVWQEKFSVSDIWGLRPTSIW